jgi:hypothetical protein
MERCTNVGYPGNFRQPITEVYFRKMGTAERDISLRWTAPISRVRTTIGGRAADVTSRSGLLRKGEPGIQVQIDFAQSLPCLLLEGDGFSTDSTWETSLDGEHWVLPEISGRDPERLPDAEREVTVSLPVDHVVEPAGPPQSEYLVRHGSDVLLDFRETELGALRFEARGKGDLIVQVGESIVEVRDPDARFFEQYPLKPVTLTSQSTSTTLPQRALRFVRFSTTGEAELRNVKFDASLWPAEEHGRFESSDPDLNRIWSTAVATLRSNMHDFYLDGIRRDGLLWHDGPLTLDAYERVFFDADLSRQTLIGQTLPDHPTVRDVGIIDGAMYNVIAFEREYLVRGDPSFSRVFRERIEAILQFYISMQNERGFVDAAKVEPYGFFPDWSATEETGPDGHGTPAYGQMLLSRTFAAAARLAGAWNDNAAQTRYEKAAIKLRDSVRQTFWRRQEGLFANGFYGNGTMDVRFTSFAQAFAVACDIATPDQYDTLFRFLNDESVRSTHYSLSQVVELTAYAKAGRAAEAFKRLKSAWLPMIQQGYRRFFEDIDATKNANTQLLMYGRRYGNSLCHAWAGAAPIMTLSRGVLGIEPVEPGYRVCSFVPQRCGLDSVRGSVPTPTGLIEVEWHGTKGQLRLPDSVSARCSDGRVFNGPGRFGFNFP